MLIISLIKHNIPYKIFRRITHETHFLCVIIIIIRNQDLQYQRYVQHIRYYKQKITCDIFTIRLALIVAYACPTLNLLNRSNCPLHLAPIVYSHPLMKNSRSFPTGCLDCIFLIPGYSGPDLGPALDCPGSVDCSNCSARELWTLKAYLSKQRPCSLAGRLHPREVNTKWVLHMGWRTSETVLNLHNSDQKNQLRQTEGNKLFSMFSVEQIITRTIIFKNHNKIHIEKDIYYNFPK